MWLLIKPHLPPEREPGTPGRPPLPNRKVLNGVLHVLRTGCQWKALQTEWFGASSSIHARFQVWCQLGIWRRIFQILLRYYDKVLGIQWRWQALDSKSVAAPLGGEQTGKNPTDRAKLGSKRHILVDARGAPLAIVVSGANAHDKTCALSVLNAQVIRPPHTTYRIQHFCADKAYDADDLRRALLRRHYQVHISRRTYSLEEKPARKKIYPARRWVVERTLSWQNDFRSLRTRWSKKADNWLGFLYFASALVLWKMTASA
jgi:putative transposase